MIECLLTGDTFIHLSSCVNFMCLETDINSHICSPIDTSTDSSLPCLDCLLVILSMKVSYHDLNINSLNHCFSKSHYFEINWAYELFVVLTIYLTGTLNPSILTYIHFCTLKLYLKFLDTKSYSLI